MRSYSALSMKMGAIGGAARTPAKTAVARENGKKGGGSLRDARYSSAERSRRALAITETELSDIASAAIIGLSSKPKTG